MFLGLLLQEVKLSPPSIEHFISTDVSKRTPGRTTSYIALDFAARGIAESPI